MSNNNVVSIQNPALPDPLQEVLKEGARQLLEQAVHAELAELLDRYRSLTTEDGKAAVVRNGYTCPNERYRPA